MDAEERHELKENDLASWLQYGLPMFLKQNGSYIVLVAALCFLGFQLYRMYEQKKENTRIQAWSELRSAGSSDDPARKIQSVIDTYDIKQLREEAYLELGNYYGRLPMAQQQMATMKITAQEAIKQSYDSYKKAFDIAGDDTLTAGKALLGMAAACEDLANWADAKKIYDQLADKKGAFKDTPFGDVATERLASLDDREKAPRLIAMIPPPATKPAETAPAAIGNLPGMFGPTLPEAGGLGGLGTGGAAPSFGGPALPDIVPAPVPATAPATAPR
jgi:hypothetical protein